MSSDCVFVIGVSGVVADKAGISQSQLQPSVLGRSDDTRHLADGLRIEPTIAGSGRREFADSA